jgi:hypothetical protein
VASSAEAQRHQKCACVTVRRPLNGYHVASGDRHDSQPWVIIGGVKQMARRPRPDGRGPTGVDCPEMQYPISSNPPGAT